MLGPSWFAAIMGTGIVANAAVTLPKTFPGLRTAARTHSQLFIWPAVALYAVLVAAWAVVAARSLRHAAQHA
jgi:tellurite resistance protein TehA-like permease